MTIADIINYRLLNQQIAATTFKKPKEIVSWMGAMQAQDFAMAKWAIGLRLPGSNEADIEKAFNKGEILRTHLLRPTWHFVTPEDIRWLLLLTAPQINKLIASYHRKLELDEAIFRRSNNILTKVLQGNHLTRTALKEALERKKISAKGIRLAFLIMRAELDGLICSGPRVGKQFTYALLDDRVPKTKPIDRSEALSKLLTRYFNSRGPATVKDFAYWSGLTMKEAKEGLESLKSQFSREIIDGEEYLFVPAMLENKQMKLLDNSAKTSKFQTSFLMPDYDEYGMSYKDRSAYFNQEVLKKSSKNSTVVKNSVYDHLIVIDGQMAGAWKKVIKNKTTAIETTPYFSLSKRKQQVLVNAVKKYNQFVSDQIDENKVVKKK